MSHFESPQFSNSSKQKNFLSMKKKPSIDDLVSYYKHRTKIENEKRRYKDLENLFYEKIFNSKLQKYDTNVYNFLKTLPNLEYDFISKFLYAKNIKLNLINDILNDRLSLNSFRDDSSLFKILLKIKEESTKAGWILIKGKDIGLKDLDTGQQKYTQNLLRRKESRKILVGQPKIKGISNTPLVLSPMVKGNSKSFYSKNKGKNNISFSLNILNKDVILSKKSKKELLKLDPCLQKKTIDVLNDVSNMNRSNVITRCHRTKLLVSQKHYESSINAQGGGFRIIWNFCSKDSKKILIESIIKHNVLDTTRIGKKIKNLGNQSF